MNEKEKAMNSQEYKKMIKKPKENVTRKKKSGSTKNGLKQKEIKN